MTTRLRWLTFCGLVCLPLIASAQVFPNNGVFPRRVQPNAAFGPNTRRDHSGQLIEAIQRTVAPSTWDVNGGQGAIYYFRRNHSLIIKQTTQGHEQMQDVIQQLRRQ
ncbi:MAG: hypothetical protein QM811_20080 [Pirellulales bacterium]